MTWTDSHAERRRALVKSFSAQAGQWGFKDPRTVLTLAFWREELPDMVRVGTIRHPLAVARSLFSRDKVPLEKGFHLWECYNRIVLEEYRRKSFPVVDFDLDTENYKLAVETLIRRTGLVETPRAIALSFFTDSLRHQKIAEADLSQIPQSAAVLV